MSDLGWALEQFRSERITRYKLYSEYYEGCHTLAFATDKFRNTFGNTFKEFAENACSAVVDSLTDRLAVTGFKTSEARVVTEDVSTGPTVAGSPQASIKKVTVQDDLGQQILDIWNRNRMDLKSNEVHEETLTVGDSYAIVWPNASGQAEVFPQKGIQCCIEYESEDSKTTLRAAKVWYDVNLRKWRVNVYLPTEIVKYAQNNTSDTLAEKDTAFSLVGRVPNPYGIVPMFHFPNKRVRQYGVSELRDVLPLQNALNKSVMDMLIAMEFASYKQRYVIGLEVEMDEATGQPVDPQYRSFGVDRMMAIPDIEAKVGQFDATDLSQFLRVQEKFWASIARVSGTPLHYFFITQGDFPSGEAMKSAEARFVKKITDRQTGFGNVWEDAMKFALRIESESSVSDDLQVETLWVDAAPKSEAELADTAVKKKAVGVSRSQILKEMGYDDETVYRMLEESDAYTASQAAMESTLQQQRQENVAPPRQTSGTQGVRNP